MENGVRTVAYTYDDLYRLTRETITNDPAANNGQISYVYDAVGNRQSRTSTLAAIPNQSFSYDANDRVTTDTFDQNGNTIGQNGNSYQFDFENKLTNFDNGQTTFVYDGDGNRVSKTTGGVTTKYLVDTQNHTGYAQVVEELQGGNVTKQFTFGHDLISQRTSANVSFYQYDGHGSVRQLTNTAGVITDTHTYDAFGNLISRTGTTANDYLYAGEQFDGNLGFYYLRARYMNPSSGRFHSMDSFGGSGSDPITLHKYLYANSNPANIIDPSGYYGIADFSVRSAISSIINAMPAFQGGATTALVPLAAKTGALSTIGSGSLAIAGAASARALSFAVSLAIGFGAAALTKLKQSEENDGYYYITIYRSSNNLTKRNPIQDFTIGGSSVDNDGYLSVWHDHTISERYNIPMLARFRKGDRYNGQLITPFFDSSEIRVFHNPLLDDPHPAGNQHYSLEFYGASNRRGENGSQGDIPG